MLERRAIPVHMDERYLTEAAAYYAALPDRLAWLVDQLECPSSRFYQQTRAILKHIGPEKLAELQYPATGELVRQWISQDA